MAACVAAQGANAAWRAHKGRYARVTAICSTTFAHLMLIEFFLKLKQSGLPVSVREFLTLLEGLDKRVVSGSIDDFYYLSRACLVKDETNYDKFDRAFGA